MKSLRTILLLCFAIGLTLPGRAQFSPDEEFVTKVYIVPGFFDPANQPPSLDIPHPRVEADATMDPGERRPTATQVLERAGIEFPSGTKAIYNPATTELIVQHTAEVHSRVRAHFASMTARRSQLQIHLKVRELRFQGEFLDHIQWHDGEGAEEGEAGARVAKAWRISAPDFVKDLTLRLFLFPRPQPGQKAGVFDMIFDEFESFHEKLARPPLAEKEVQGARQLDATETLDDPQFQLLIRVLGETGNFNLESHPTVMVRAGQPALVQSGESRVGIVPTLIDGPDNEVALDLYLPEVGKALDAGTSSRPRPSIRTRLEDGSTVVVAEKNASGDNRIVFVTAQILYPPGALDSIDLPEKTRDEESALEGAVFPEAAEAIQRADEFALTARRLFDDGAFAEAESFFGTALHALPEGGAAAPRRQAYEKQKSRAREATERQRRESRVRFAREGETLEQIAAEAGVSPERLREANRLDGQPVKAGQMLLLPPAAEAPSQTMELLESTVLPVVEFDGLPFAECLATVQQELLRLKGPDFPGDATPIIVLSAPWKRGETKITLRLRHVPAIEALRHLASLAGCQIAVEGREVRITDQAAKE